MKKLMLLICMSAGLSAMDKQPLSPSKSPVKRKTAGEINATRDRLFKDLDSQEIPRKRARKIARSVVKQLKYENNQE